MVQPIVFDREAFVTYIPASPFIALDWSRFPVQLGRKLSSYAPIGFPNVDQLPNARAGIRHYRQMALDQTVLALVPVDNDGSFGRAPEPLLVTADLLVELYHSIVTRTMTNALMALAHDNSGVKGLALIAAFLRHLPQLESHRAFAEELVREQERARLGEAFVFDAATAQASAVTFLDDLTAICLGS